MPPLPKTKTVLKPADALRKLKACIACEGTGRSSRGSVCSPCNGKGVRR